MHECSSEERDRANLSINGLNERVLNSNCNYVHETEKGIDFACTQRYCAIVANDVESLDDTHVIAFT